MDLGKENIPERFFTRFELWAHTAFVKWFPGVMGTGATTRIGNDPVIITDSMGQKHGNVWIEVHGKLFMENTVRPKNYGRGLCLLCLLWLLHMRTSSMETFSSLLALYAGNSPVTGEFPSQRLVIWCHHAHYDITVMQVSFNHIPALAITPSHQQNTHDFADGRKNMNDIFNNYVCSVSHMRSGLHFQNV